MALNLIVGPANGGKTSIVNARLRECADAGERVILLLPAGPDVSRALDRLASSIPLGLSIRTFDDYLDDLWLVHGDGRTITTPVQRLALLAESVKMWTPDIVATPLGSPGIIRSLAMLVQRAGEAKILSRPIEGASGIAEDLMRCVVTYMGNLSSAGLVERSEAHRLVVGLLGGIELPGLIAVNHFTGFTLAQEEFLRQASRASELVVCLTHDSGIPATAAASGTVERLGALGSVRRVGKSEASGGPAELVQLQRCFGRAGSPSVEDTGSVVLSEAWGEAAEAARIVAEVQDVIGDGVEPGEIAIVYRDVAPHMQELRAAFGEAGIPAEFDARVPFALTGIGRAILTVLRFVGEGPSHGELMDLLRSPFSPATDSNLDMLDAAYRRVRVSGVGFAQEWLDVRDRETATFLREARRASRQVAGPGAERRWYRLVSGMLRRGHAAAGSVEAEVLLDAGAARVLVEAVRSLSALGDGRVAPEVLASALREAQVSVTSDNRDECVQVMGAERIRGRRYSCVIVAGLTAGEFPRRMTDDALSAPAVSRSLARFGVDAGARGSTEAERQLFYQVITRAEERLVLSRQTHDVDGTTLRSSIFVDEVLDLYRDQGSGAYPFGEPSTHVLGLDPLTASPAAPSTPRRALRDLAANPAAGADTEALHSARRRAARIRPQGSAAVREAIEGRDVFSASEIETYLQCRFRWYIQRLVRPRELDERLDAAAAGRLAHDIMCHFYATFAERTGESRITQASLAIAREIHSEVAAARLAEVGASSAAEAAMARATARRTARLIEADATLLPGMSPLHHEWSFGLEEGDAPEAFEGFLLAGRVDRIDADATRLVITDYKRGTIDARRGAAAFEAEGIVQLPLYAAVAARRLDLEVAGAVYRSIGGTKPRGFVREDLGGDAFVRTDITDALEIAGHIAHAVERAMTAVEGMRAGDIHAEPRGGSCPPYCPARGFCAEWRPSRG